MTNCFKMDRFKYYFLRVSQMALLVLFIQCTKDNNAPLVEFGDVTDQIVLLGNPLTAKYQNGTPKVYARNIWDMHAFGNKIYFGSGNSSNEGPAPNSGPAVLWSYDIAKQEFVNEFTTTD